MKSFCVAACIVSVLCQQSAPSRVGSSTPTTLLTNNRTEGLSEEARIVIATNYILNLDPGVSARKIDDTVTLSTYDGAKIKVGLGSESFKVASNTIARLTSKGWDLGTGRIYPISDLHFSRDEQDDTDNNLKSMQESAKKLKSKNSDTTQDNKGPTKKLKVRFLYGENPNPTAELFNSAAIQQLTHLSNIGF